MFDDKVKELIDSGVDIRVVLACIYDLYQNYEIDEDDMNRLYALADPKDEYNDVSEYWHDYEGDNLLLKGGE